MIPLQHLPASLTALDVGEIAFSPSVLGAFLRSKRCPNLQHINYSTGTVMSPNWQAREGDQWWSEDRDEVMALLSELGIRGVAFRSEVAV